MPDSDILAANFKLSDAQEMVARQHGFDSWQALKGGLSTTSRKVKPSPSKATIVCAEPQLFVTDIKRACEFFQKKLGFTLVFSYGKPPYYAQVGRDAARLNLRCVERPAIESTVRDREELLSVSMTVASADEIKMLFLEFQSAGVAFLQTLKKQPWGAKNFIVKDPDGNLLLLPGRQTSSHQVDVLLRVLAVITVPGADDDVFLWNVGMVCVNVRLEFQLQLAERSRRF
jgi:catechol 2,3-dioxygenase-like lactoylglutathione lyase family enzyme